MPVHLLAALGGALIVVLLLVVFLLRRRSFASDKTVFEKVEKAHEKEEKGCCHVSERIVTHADNFAE